MLREENEEDVAEGLHYFLESLKSVQRLKIQPHNNTPEH